MTYLEFFGGSYFLAWCSLWLFWAVVPLAWTLFLLVNRVLRTIKVIFIGWPPEHLDADGDWAPEPKSKNAGSILRKSSNTSDHT